MSNDKKGFEVRYVVVDHAEKRKKHRRKLRHAAFALAAAAVLAIAVAFFVYRRSMTPTVLQIAEVRVKAETMRVVNEAVADVFDNVDYKTLIFVEKNDENDITLLSANSAAINSLARDTALLTQSKIDASFSEDIQIPLGTLSGITLLSERGPSVNIKVSPVGTVNCVFYSKFESAGINQTLHRIYLEVTGSVDLIVPSMYKTLQISTPILISETVIVGKVPDTYLQGSLLWNEV